MKYSININQAGIADAGLADKTDVVDWAIIDYIFGWQGHPKATKIGSMAWINYQHLIDEMPLLGLKAKQSVSNRMSKLRLLGLISVEYDKEKRLYASISETTHGIINFRASRPSIKAGVLPEEHPVPFQEHPPVPRGGHTAVNQRSRETVNQEQIDTHQPKSAVDDRAIADNDAFNAFWSAYPRKKNRAAAIKAFGRIKPELLPTLFADIEARIRVGDWRLDQPEFIPHPATYLNGERWTDVITPRSKNDETSRYIDRPRSPGERFAALRAAQQAASRGNGQTLDGDAEHFRPPIREQFWPGAIGRLGDNSSRDHPEDDRNRHRADEDD